MYDDEDWDNEAPPVTKSNQTGGYYNNYSQDSQNTWNNRDRDSTRSNSYNNGGGRTFRNSDSRFSNSSRNSYSRDNNSWRSKGNDDGEHREQYRDNRRSGGGGGNNDPMEVMKVPSSFVGRIIGRGGSKIQELQITSGAKIMVTKDTEGDETIVKLFGNSNDIQKAKELIQELTTERSERRFDHQQFSTPPSPPAPKRQITDWQAFMRECDEKEKEQWAQYPEIRKEFYVEHPDITKLTAKEVEEFRLASNNVVVDRTFEKEGSKQIPKPIIHFHHAFHNYPEILEEIAKAGFEKPSPIQSQAWPILLSGEDLIGIAQTGTGKTLAFLLPALVHIDGQPTNRSNRGGPAVLIMAPTRELALQIDREIKKYQYKGISSVCLYGGGSRRDQVKVCTDGVDIVIATPGRLNDLVVAGHLNVKTVTYVVLDEADRMLDMGFEPQIRKVMYQIRPTRQTVMTSATWPLGVRRLADSYMDNPVQVYVGSLDLAATHTVTQTVVMMPDNDQEKMEYFMKFCHNLSSDHKIIVFCGKKARADELSSELAMAGVHCQTIHGDRDQSDREQALVDIADGTVQILIATDVASRGLDIEDITHVINYDFPRNIEEYVHRVGRTGRAGRFGESISYFTRADWGQAKELILILEEANQFVPDELHKMAERHGAWKERKDSENQGSGGRFGGRGGRGRGGGGFGNRNRW